MEQNELHFLLELLDDDNEQSVSLAMAQLLKHDAASLDQCLCSLQESDNPRLRRRVHQLESAIRARRKRVRLESRLKRSSVPLLDGCIQLHLAWFDNDLAENVMDQWRELIAGLRKASGTAYPALRDIARFLGRNFQVPLNDDISADFYCFGVVIDDRCGSDLLLSVTALELLRATGKDGFIVRKGDDFGVMDSDENLLTPGISWEYTPARRTFFRRTDGDFRKISDPAVLRYIASMLFFCAVGTDSFRYIYTIGRTLTAIAGVPEGLSTLPSPYNPENGKK